MEERLRKKKHECCWGKCRCVCCFSSERFYSFMTKLSIFTDMLLIGMWLYYLIGSYTFLIDQVWDIEDPFLRQERLQFMHGMQVVQWLFITQYIYVFLTIMMKSGCLLDCLLHMALLGHQVALNSKSTSQM